MTEDRGEQDWIEKGRQKLAEEAKQEEAIIAESRALHKLYAEAIKKLFDELSVLARQLGLEITQDPPKTVKNTLINEHFQISGDLMISHGQRKRRSICLIPGDLAQNLIPPAFSGIEIETQPSDLLPFNELFFAERDQTWVVRINVGEPSKPSYETKPITAEALIKTAFLHEKNST